MREERDEMRPRRCGEKSNRGCVWSQHCFFDANARVNHAREYGPKNQSGDGCNDPTDSSSAHVFLVMQDDSAVATAIEGARSFVFKFLSFAIRHPWLMAAYRHHFAFIVLNECHLRVILFE